MDASFIVAFSLVIFLGIAYRLGYKKAMGALDQKIATIRDTLQEAANAKEEAMQTLHKARKNHAEIMKEVKVIAKRTEEQALLLRQQALEDIEKIITTRQHTAKTIIDRLQQNAIQTLQDEATAKTVATFEALAAQELSPAQHEALNDNAINKIAAQLSKNQTAVTTKTKRLKSKRLTVR